MDSGYKDFVLDFDEVVTAGVSVSGGKGYNLGQLKRFGFPVPPGCVLSTAACRSFMVQNGLIEHGEKALSGGIGGKEFEQGLEAFRERIHRGVFPSYLEEALTSKLQRLGILARPLAVRSSAASEDSTDASFAGIYDSFLNVLGPDRLFAAIRACFASLWTPKAVAYRRRMNINNHEPALAVVIMEMVNARAAGVGFSCNPRTGRQDEIVINASFGLAEAVVGGLVEPDEYHLNLGLFTPEIREKRIGTKEGMSTVSEDGGTDFIRADFAADHAKDNSQALSDDQMIRLASIVVRVFDTLGKGQQHQRSEERRVGKECRSRWSPYH